jgi:hypothetical protein
MERKVRQEIVIPDIENYRAGIPVFSASVISYDIVTPKYEPSMMAGRVLHPIARREVK